MTPALLHLSFAAAYPEILDELLVYAMLGRLGSMVLTIAYLVVLFGTFIETGIGDAGVLERLDARRLEAPARCSRRRSARRWRGACSRLARSRRSGSST